ncbi:fungal-specific transcription factor domain-containing protein [Achaetomium macrosporum]|uniref:Fungal-specific transcription factor domain-containing protein n=1 Tax=Achaetomium macrosporum TaxID=79813 RepID=A0AAN7CFZ4_9PEZI|nr:fungal-specific transcription factor domain-containing protein [Achaetomium macrosporum]
MSAAFSNTAPGASESHGAKPGVSRFGSAPQPRRKRSQVVRACDWCRKHRVKCDSHSPCSNCAKRGGECSNESVTETSLPLAHREIERLRRKVQELELELRQERARSLASSSLSPPALSVSSEYADSSRINFWGGIRMSTARSPHKTWYGPSSLFYFIGRINSFLDGTLQQPCSADHMLLDSSSRRLDEPTATPEPEEPSHGYSADPTGSPVTKATYLSPTQEEYFLDLFWQSYHTSLFPILDEAGFKEHYRSLWTASGNTRKPSALVDIVVAMCMQYGMSMLPAVKQQDFGDNNDAAIAGRWHYRRSQTLLARELESPNVSTLQCHLLCCIYLCCGSFQNMADSACGLAVRAAYMLGLHLDPPLSMPQREREMRKRLWWALYVLDSKIGMKLGRPFLLPHLSNATPSLPGDDLEAALQSGSNFAPLGDNITWLSFNLQQAKLFRAARTVHTAFYDRSPNVDDGRTMWDDQQALASHAEFIRPCMRGLDQWAAGVPVALTTKRQNNAAAFSTDVSALDIEQFAPLWLQRQRLLLELMYHNLCTNLYRPFISFVSAPTSAVAEEAAIKCALHAMALTNIMHQVLLTTTILAGWHEAFQLQWNAAITLVGFVLSHPHSASAAEARKAIDLSVAVFDIFSNSFAVATSAAKIMRDLGAKVDFLKQQQGQSDTSLPQANEAAVQMMMPGNSKILDNVLSMPDISTVSKTWDGALSCDDLNTASMQDVFNMAFAVDEWSNLDSLWPNMDQTMPEQYILGL